MCAREIEKPKYEIVGELERFDEADNTQARGELVPDSQLWKDYFSNHPELETYSREWLKLPPLGTRAACCGRDDAGLHVRNHRSDEYG